jgi:hypothetical protein
MQMGSTALQDTNYGVPIHYQICTVIQVIPMQPRATPIVVSWMIQNVRPLVQVVLVAQLLLTSTTRSTVLAQPLLMPTIQLPVVALKKRYAQQPALLAMLVTRSIQIMQLGLL